MSTIEDYKLQYSLKFGQGGNTMVNVRAQSVDELEELLTGLVGKGPDIAAASEALGAVVTVSQGMPGTTVVNSPGQTVDSSAKTCGHQGPQGWVPHGQMKFIEKPDYAGHFCPLEKNDPNRCRPVYVRRGK